MTDDVSSVIWDTHNFDGAQVDILLLAETLHRACKPKGLAESLAGEILCSTIVNFREMAKLLQKLQSYRENV